MRSFSINSTLLLGVIVMTLVSNCCAQLRVGFYNGKCGNNDVEKVIFEFIKTKIAEEPDTVSDFVRLSFHDCFVEGCDGSIFIKGPNAEQSADVNQGLGGLDTMDELKAEIEKVCSGVVSCADALVMATRDAISLAGGNRFEVETGRMDGLVSNKNAAQQNLPPPTITIPQSIQLFASRGLDKNDMVILLGGHTVGTAHCHSFKERLYNFKNTNQPDPSVNTTLLPLLRQTCPLNDTTDNETFLDQTPNSHFTIDNGYFNQILSNNGVMEIDSNLAQSPATRGIATVLANNPDHFLNLFNLAMVKMARINVKTGSQGEIRKTCGSFN